MQIFKKTFIVAFLSSAVLCANAAEFYVATNGDDSLPGSPAQPWRTIQHAANSVSPGDTVFVHGGIYSERVTFGTSGTTGNPVTFQNYPGENPVVDGTGLPIPRLDYATGLFEFTNASYLVVQGFELRNYQTQSASFTPAGIDITGAPHDLTFVSNRVHDIANLNKTRAANAYGIAVHGTLPQAISNLVFRGNEICSNVLGQSETFSLDGNCNGFEISGNFVHDNNNIGIGFIGWEKVCSDKRQDYARNGICRSNVVQNISDANNPAYPPSDFSADGIYCDGASNVVIELNQVVNCDIGVEMASEHHGHAASACICRNNLIWSNNSAGISIGGYASKVGRTENCLITGNTLFHNNTQWTNLAVGGFGEFLLQFDPVSNVFTNNVVVANEQNLLIANPFKQNVKNLIDWNVYFAPGGSNNSVWQWKKKSYVGFAAYRAATTNDAHSVFTNPFP